MLKGVHRSAPDRLRRRRLPITPSILRRLHSVWSTPPVTFNNRMLWAASCLGFFGFLRAGEFTCPSLAAFSSDMLAVQDVSVNSPTDPQYLAVFLRSSKTDIFGAGLHIYLGRTGDLLCPVAALLGYLSIRPPSPGPLFIFEDGSLSRSLLVRRLREALQSTGLDTLSFNGHSFRIGAATAAAQAGLSDALIKTLGRWKSSAYASYIRSPRDSLLAVAPALART